MRFARAALVAYSGLLAVVGVLGLEWDAGARPLDLAHLRDPVALIGWLGETAAAALLEASRFVPIGALAMLAMGSPTGGRRWLVRLGGLTIALLATTAIRGFEPGRAWGWPGVVPLLAAGLGGAVGIQVARWRSSAGARGARPVRALGWRAATIAMAIVLALAGAAGGAVWLAVEREPLAFEVPRVTAEDKRQLRRVFAGADPRSLADGKTRTLRLTEAEMNGLITWALALEGDPRRRARIDLADGQARVRLSVPLPVRGAGPAFLNVDASGAVAVDAGRPDLRPDRLRIGRLVMPRWLLRLLAPLALRASADDPRVRALLEPIGELAIEGRAVRVVYGRVDLPPGFVTDLFGGERAMAALLPSVEAHLEHLLERAATLPRGDAGFGAALEAAFRLASERTEERDDARAAVLENKAAILALATLGGHWRIGQALGGAVEKKARGDGRRGFRTMTVRHRPDWVRHFLVSAALAVLADEGVSLAAGVLKEELDAQGRSGFSFGDLLADRAGTMFATTAIRDADTAAAMQARLTRGFRVDDFFPPAHDLPEGMSDRELESRYGGPDGQGFRDIVAEIDRRIAACAAYQVGAP